MSRLYGVAGLKTAGKDAFADALVDQLGWVKIGMAENLHNCLMVLNPIIGRRWFRTERYRDLVGRVGYVVAKQSAEVRRLQQVFGTEVGRDMIDVNIWTDMTGRTIADLRARGIDVVVTGIRFQSELDMIRNAGGETFWIDRPGLVTGDGHSSENSLGPDDCYMTIANVGSVEDLRAAAVEIGSVWTWTDAA